jgi:GMP synthase (glutamine-hydrolysing)
MMKICVIDTGDDNSTDFTKILEQADVTMYNMNDQALLEKVTGGAFDGIILTGSTKCVHDEGEQLPVELLDLGVPILGISYGFQWMVVARGGVVTECEDQLVHKYEKYIGVAQPFLVSVRKYKFSHKEFIEQLPVGWVNMCQQENQCWVAAESTTRHLGVQFQPELVDATGREFFASWLQWIKPASIEMVPETPAPTEMVPETPAPTEMETV